MEHKPDSREQLEKSSGDQGTPWFFINETATTKTLPSPTKVIEFPSSMTLGQALHSLAEHHILSAPVWDEASTKYLGFIDVFDLMTLSVGVDALFHLLPRDAFAKRPHTAKDVAFQKEMTLLELMTTSSGLQAAEGGFSPWLPVAEGARLIEVVKLLATSARRVPVLSPETGRVVQIISQSQVSALLAGYAKKENLLSLDTLETSGFGLKPVYSVKEGEPVRNAFNLMVEKKISSVVVVDEKTGAHVTAISTKDVRLLPKLEALAVDREKSLFDLNCVEFAQRVRREEYKTKAACVVAEIDSSLLSVLEKLAATKMHRVYIVNREKQPVGVISVSDVVVALEQVQPH